MLIFRDEILKQCSASELASLLTIAQTHNVEAVTDEVSQNQEAAWSQEGNHCDRPHDAHFYLPYDSYR